MVVGSGDCPEPEVAAAGTIPPEFKELAAASFLLLRDALFAHVKNG